MTFRVILNYVTKMNKVLNRPFSAILFALLLIQGSYQSTAPAAGDLISYSLSQ